MKKAKFYYTKLCAKISALILFTLLSFTVIIHSQSNRQKFITLKVKENWAEKTKAAIDNVIINNSGKSSAYAVFDWDNTSIYSDVQNILFIYQIEQLAFKMTPDEFRYSFTHYIDTGYNSNLEIPAKNFLSKFKNASGKAININMIAEDCYNDYKYFYNNYRAMNPNSTGDLSLEKLKESNQFKDFRAKMWFTYTALEETFQPNVAYTWVLYVTCPGFMQWEIKSMVKKAVDAGIKSENKKKYFESPSALPGVSGIVSNKSIDNYFVSGIVPTQEIGLLFKKLESKNIPVYICTASLQDVIEVIATDPKYNYNLPKDHVLGLRLKKNKNEKYIAQYDNSKGYTINSMEGKAYNINNILVTKYHANPIIIAGDSNGDYAMMTQFSGLNGVAMLNKYKPVQLILVINRLRGGKIGGICKIAVEQMSRKTGGSTVVVLQGRDENTGQWLPTEKTLKLGLSGSANLKLLP